MTPQRTGTCCFSGIRLWHQDLCWDRGTREDTGAVPGNRSPTCVSEPVEAAPSGLGDLSVGGSRVGAAGVAGGGCGVHLWLAHVEETHVQLQVTAPTGLGHVGAEQGLSGTEGFGAQWTLLKPLASGLLRAYCVPGLVPGTEDSNTNELGHKFCILTG